MASSINPYVNTQQISLKSRPLSRQKLPVLDERSASPRTTNCRPSTVIGDFHTKLFEFSSRKLSRTSNSCPIYYRKFYYPTRVSCNGLQNTSARLPLRTAQSMSMSRMWIMSKGTEVSIRQTNALCLHWKSCCPMISAWALEGKHCTSLSMKTEVMTCLREGSLYNRRLETIIACPV